jgi:hypothetical protein
VRNFSASEPNTLSPRSDLFLLAGRSAPPGGK